MGEPLSNHSLNIENIVSSRALQQDKDLNLFLSGLRRTKLTHQKYNIPGIQIRWGQRCPFKNIWVRMLSALFGQRSNPPRRRFWLCDWWLPARDVPLMISSQDPFSGRKLSSPVKTGNPMQGSVAGGRWSHPPAPVPFPWQAEQQIPPSLFLWSLWCMDKDGA